MFPVQQFRTAVSRRLGQVLTPEIAALIESETRIGDDRTPDPKQFGSQEHHGYILRAERFAEIQDELHPLHETHWLETEAHRHGLALKPRYDVLLAKERAGQLYQFTARHGSEIAAQVRMYVGTSTHTSTLVAEEDTLYLKPSHRPGGFLMLALMRFVEDSLRSIGVREIRANSKTLNNADVLMRRLGYSAVAIQFTKIFEDENVQRHE